MRARKRSAEVLSSVPKSEKAVRRKYMLYKLCSGVGPEFKVNESTIYIKKLVFKESIKQGYV